ncbi:capsular polysaccharide synthesis protein [Enterococcus hulanensis]|uniref:capsular polysaccharide synthesis protein n=1 Tax=Enterococcus hulanensis TaxID=2559929 RepID=UPI001A92A6AD|nr:capsular polysaccharide synthesis protein [Enterococcus hulanensis]MBO0412385.1 capsular polysaccharide synthesis protein [Enterococcus hulanensis]
MNSLQLARFLNITFIISKGIRKMSFPKKIQVKFNNTRHKFTIDYLEKKYGFINDKYSSNEKIEGNIPKKIWIFWWQGIESAPLVVQKCISQVKKNTNAEISIITKWNFKEYTNISNILLEKFEEGKFSITHFSDILRFNLLKNHGGLWLDSTVYIAREIPDNLWLQPYYSSGPFVDNEHFNVSLGEWSGFFQGGIKDHPFFCYMDEFFNSYWEKEDVLIDYFLIDYAMRIAQRQGILTLNNFGRNNRNSNMFNLQQKLNKEFEKSNWEEMLKDTFAFKLSYKQKISESEGTYFDELFNERK